MPAYELYDLIRHLRKTFSSFRNATVETGAEVLGTLHSRNDKKLYDEWTKLISEFNQLSEETKALHKRMQSIRMVEPIRRSSDDMFALLKPLRTVN